jgi:hypothetical protein
MASLIAVHKELASDRYTNTDEIMVHHIISHNNYTNQEQDKLFKNNPEYVDFTGFTKVEVVKALWNSRKYIKGSLGEIHNNDGKPLPDYLITNNLLGDKIDYIKGKPLKISFQYFPYIKCSKYDNYKDDNWEQTTMKDVLIKLKQNHYIPFTKQFEKEINKFNNRKLSIRFNAKNDGNDGNDNDDGNNNNDVGNTNTKEEGSCVIS